MRTLRNDCYKQKIPTYFGSRDLEVPSRIELLCSVLQTDA